MYLTWTRLFIGDLHIKWKCTGTMVKVLVWPTLQVETRCGWFSNPTPGNVWLNDRDGQWTIGIQGGYQTEGDWVWPEFKKGQWIRTNAGSYGYGCACLQVRIAKGTNRVLEIKGARAPPRSLSQRSIIKEIRAHV